MADKMLAQDLRVVEVKKDGLREELERLHERTSSLLLVTLHWKDIEDQLKATQGKLERRAEEVCSAEESIKASFKGFAARLEEIERREREIASRRRVEVERKCKEVERNVEALEVTRRAVEGRFWGIEALEKRVEEDSRSMDALIDERLREIEEREKESKYMNEKLMEKWEAFEANRSKLEGKFNEVQLKSEELECRIKNLELIEVECDERVRQAGLKEKRLLEWSKELEIQKRELEVRLREVELKDNRVNELKRDLEVRLSEDELKDNMIKELKRDIEMRLREVELKDNSIKELSKELDLRSKKRVEENINVRPGINNLSDEIHMKVLAKSPDTCLKKDGQVSNIQKHAIADGKDLQIFLNERWTEGEKLRYEVSATLRKSPDPARLVLDAMEGFYSPHLKKGDVEFDECIVRRSCILLLEQLMKISPIISPQVKTEATKLSFFWITKMRADARNSLEVLGFLQLLATYGLASAFDTDEILHYVEKIAHFRHMPELCQALGLKDKIPGFIRNLVKDNKRDVAVSFIYAFKMEKDFPPEPLLKDHMGISKNAAGEILQNGHNSPEAQNHTIRAKVDDLKTRGRCFEDRKIKSTISHENIKEAFTSVEKKDQEPEKAATEIGRIKMRELDGKLHSPAIVAAPFPSSIPASYKTAPAITIETSVQPPPQTSARPQHRGKHPQTTALAEAGSNPFASPSADAQTSHITHKEASSQNICSKPTGEILEKILSRNVEYELMRDEISALLESSSDPASLVLNTLKYTNPSNSREFIRLGIPVKHCILLLEHLRRFSPLIKPQLGQEAKQFCNCWKLNLTARKDDHMETICFLQFLAAFKLAPAVAANEVLKLLDPSKWVKQVPDSCESLGLAEFLPGFIRNLIEKKCWIDAIKYISALKMEDKFPLAPLLTDYLAYWENRADVMSKKQNNSPSSQIQAIKQKLTATKNAIKCIATYRLESDFSHKDFKAYIIQLEKQKAEIEGIPRESGAVCFAGSQHVLTKQDKKEEPPAEATSDHVATLTVTDSTAPTSAISSSHESQKKRGKKRKRIPPQPKTPKETHRGGHHSMQPYSRNQMDAHKYQMGPHHLVRSSGYHGLQIHPNNYPINPHHFSSVERGHGRTYAVPLYGGRPVHFSGPRDAYGRPRW